MNARKKRVLHVLMAVLLGTVIFCGSRGYVQAENQGTKSTEVTGTETAGTETAGTETADSKMAGTDAMDQVQPEDRPINYVALGDSIPNGYSDNAEVEICSYPHLLREDLVKLSGEETYLTMATKNGLTIPKMNSIYLDDPEIEQKIADADLITVTIGSNDLMNQFKKVSKDILKNDTKFHTADEALSALKDGISENPLLLIDVTSAISGWDYDTFEGNWLMIMEKIQAERKDGSQMVVTTIYNPTEKMELPGTLNAVVETIISKMNEIIANHAEEYDYQVIELMDSGIGELTQSDGLHPSQDGQVMLKELIESQVNFDAFPKKASADEEQKAIEAAHKRELKAAADQRAKEAAKKQRIQKQKKWKRIGIVASVVVLLIVVIIRWRMRKRRNKNGYNDDVRPDSDKGTARRGTKK